MSERLLTTRQVADFLRLSPESVLRRWRAGEIPGNRLASNVLRFRESELEAWLAGTRTNGSGAGGEVAPVPFQSPDPPPSLTVAPVPNRGGEDAG